MHVNANSILLSILKIIRSYFQAVGTIVLGFLNSLLLFSFLINICLSVNLTAAVFRVLPNAAGVSGVGVVLE